MFKSKCTEIMRTLRRLPIVINFARTTATTRRHTQAGTSHCLIEKEHKNSACNYDSLGVVITRGEGSHVWDIEGNKYMDFLSGFGALNLGHCHSRVVNTVVEQGPTLHLTTRVFHNNILPVFCEWLCCYFDYEKALVLNTGTEACEAAIKIARRWGYSVKKVCENHAIVVLPEGNSWGSIMAGLSTSSCPDAFDKFGPYMSGFGLIPFNDIDCVEEAFQNPEVVAYMMEPILTEAGVCVPTPRYLAEVRRLCNQYNVLWICDERVTGLGRTGALLACDHECVKPDVLILGGSLSGGMQPLSAVLAMEDVMNVICPGGHSSTFGGNPLSARLGMTTMAVLSEEGLVQNAIKQGERFRAELICRLPKTVIPEIQGKGLLNAISINPAYGTAADFCELLRRNGMLTRPCTSRIVRFWPPLVITDDEICAALDIIARTVAELAPCCTSSC